MRLFRRTLSKDIDSSLWRGTIVIISISQRKATSVGTRPDGNGRAILISCFFLFLLLFVGRLVRGIAIGLVGLYGMK